MSTRRQLGALVAVCLGGLAAVSLIAVGVIFFVRTEIVQLSRETSPTQVNIARLQRGFERINASFARISAASTPEELQQIDAESAQTLRDISQTVQRLTAAHAEMDTEIVESLRSTNTRFQTLARDRISARRRVEEQNRKVSGQVDEILAVTVSLSETTGRLQKESQSVLLESKKGSEEANSTIKTMLELADRAEQLRFSLQEVRLTDKRFRLNVVKDKAHSVLEALAAQEIHDAKLNAEVKAFGQTFLQGFEGDTGLVAARNEVIQHPQDEKVKDAYEAKAKALGATLEAFLTRLRESIDPLQLAVAKASSRMTTATALMETMTQVASLTAEAGSRARTIQALAWQLLSAGDADAVAKAKEQISSQTSGATSALVQVRKRLTEMKSDKEAASAGKAMGAFAHAEEALIGPAGMAASVNASIEEQAGAEKLARGALQSIGTIAAAGSNRADEAESAQAVAVARIQNVSTATLLGLSILSALVLVASLTVARKIRRSILQSEEQHARAAEQVSGLIEAIARNTDELRTASDGLTNTSRLVTASIDEVAGRASDMATHSEQISANTTEARRVAAVAASTAADVAKSVAQLGAAGREISAVTGIIQSITMRTNMLALNAAIEAACAGEAGAGFGVVADEVKNLAKAAAESTSEIEGKISTVRQSVQQVVKMVGEVGEIIADIQKRQDAIGEVTEKQNALTVAIQDAARRTAAECQGDDREGLTGRAQQLASMAKNLDRLCQEATAARHAIR